MALNAQSFETHASKSDIPLLVDFWAPWCGPCKAMAPQFEKAAGTLEPRVRLAKVNTDDEQELAGRFRIQGIPTMILFQHGKEIARQSGAMNASGIESWVQQALSYAAGCTFIQCRAISSRVATQTLGFDAT